MSEASIPAHSLVIYRQPCLQKVCLVQVFGPFDQCIASIKHSLSWPSPLQRLLSSENLTSLFVIVMADLFSTVAAVVSVADVMIRTCDGISTLVLGLKDAPQAAQHLQQTVQNVRSVPTTARCPGEGAPKGQVGL